MKKQNQILLGIIVFIVGFMMLFKSDFLMIVSPNVMVPLFFGLVFMLLYKTKRVSWALILGGLSLFLAVSGFVSHNFKEGLMANILGASCFIIPAIIFFVLYFDKNKTGLLTPASLMFWFGIFSFIRSTVSEIDFGQSLFFVFAFLAFITIFIIGHKHTGRWPLTVALVFLCLIFYSRFKGMFGGLSFRSVAAIVIMFFSVSIIFRAFKNGSKRNQ